MPAFVGTWVETGIKWTRPPAELHLNQHFAECAILYFAPNHGFALIYATLIQSAEVRRGQPRRWTGCLFGHVDRESCATFISK
jgi:hypothetical protein